MCTFSLSTHNKHIITSNLKSWESNAHISVLVNVHYTIYIQSKI